jgi:hypothetical protein
VLFQKGCFTHRIRGGKGIFQSLSDPFISHLETPFIPKHFEVLSKYVLTAGTGKSAIVHTVCKGRQRVPC